MTDIHIKTAARLFGVPEDQVTREQRRGAKMVNFGIIYGMSPDSVLMKSVINKLAQTSPDLDQSAFEKAYLKDHPSPDSVSAENLRQAFSEYKTAARKIKRVAKKRDGTVGPDRIPR